MSAELVIMTAGMGSRFGGLKQAEPVTADGKERCVISGGDRVFIKKSDYKTRLVKINENGFYNLLSEKLK